MMVVLIAGRRALRAMTWLLMGVAAFVVAGVKKAIPF